MDNLIRERARFKVAPLSHDAVYTLSPDGEAPAWCMGLGGMRLRWRIAPAHRQTHKLTEGDLKDAEGHIFVSVGTAMPTGGASFGDSPRLGVMAWQGSNSYIINLAVAPETFERLLGWCQQGKIPVVDVSLIPYFHEDDKEPPVGALRGSYIDLDWDNAKYPHLEVGWFTFEWPLNPPEGANLDEVFAAQPVSAKLFSQGVNKVYEVVKSLQVPLWILCAAAVLAAIF